MRPFEDTACRHGEDEPWPRSSRYAHAEPYQDRPEPLHQTLHNAPGSTLAEDDREADRDTARWRDAQRLRVAARLLESIDLPACETGPGMVALASLRAWVIDVARGARAASKTLEEA